MHQVVIEVEWLDSATYNGWQNMEIEDFKVITSKTVGYLIGETSQVMVIAQSTGSGEPYCNVVSIPKLCITATRTLETG